MVISSTDFTDVVDQMVTLVPCTTRDRGWLNHVAIAGNTGLAAATFAITEQPRTVSVRRVVGLAGDVDAECLSDIMRWVAVWLQPAT